VSAWI